MQKAYTRWHGKIQLVSGFGGHRIVLSNSSVAEKAFSLSDLLKLLL